MIFVFLILVAMGLMIWQFKRAKAFEAKDIKEVITKVEVKEFLNMPNENVHFAEDLEVTRENRKPSRSLLEEFNPKE